MSNAARPDEKSKKNKNKKKKNPETNAESSLGGLSSALNSNMFNQLNALMSQEIPVDFEKFDEHEKRVRTEIEQIQEIMNNIQANKFDSFPDEPKKENVGSAGNKPELDAHRKMLLNELNKKIGIFDDKLQKLNNLGKEAESDPQLQKIISGLRENLTDDINRNRDLYKRFETNAS